MSSQNKSKETNKCEKCGNKYTNTVYKWCKSCQIIYLEKNFSKWTSGNKKIDDFIRETQLNVDKPNDIVFEWISYDQFSNIKEIGKSSATVYSAIWKDGPLYYDYVYDDDEEEDAMDDNVKDEGKWLRRSDKKVTLKCSNISQSVGEFLNEVKSYLIENYDDSDIRMYGISQNSDTKDYIMVLQDVCYKWCKPCQINYLKNNFMSWNSGNEEIDDFIRESQLKVNESSDLVLEWISYDQFNVVEEINATVHSAIWKDGPLCHDYDYYKRKWTRKRKSDKRVALKFLSNSKTITNEFLYKVKLYSTKSSTHVHSIYGISQNPDTGDYIAVLEYVEGENFNDWINKNRKNFSWKNKLEILYNLIYGGLEEIHQKQMVHHDFHPGNILVISGDRPCISYMVSCEEINSNMDETKIHGVMPYVAPEVFKEKPYTQAADIYSFGMIMYFVATGRQPFSDRAHDETLVLRICSGIRPEINAPKCYVDLMKKCWDSNPDKRPNVTEVLKSIQLFHNSYICDESDFKVRMRIEKEQQHYEIEKQFEIAEKYRKESFIENDRSITHPQAIYTSRLLNSVNPFTKVR